MPERTIEQQLVSYLTDAHAIERQALAQLHMAPRLAGVERLAAAFRDHERETEEHEALLRARLEAHGAKPSRVKDMTMAAGGVGFALFAGAQPDTPGKLAAHAFSYEHLERAAYELLGRVAKRAGDAETADVAARIRDQEIAMADRIAACFDEAVQASLHETGVAARSSQLVKYLTDAHAIEVQAEALLERARKVGGEASLQHAYAEHLQQTRGHRERIERLLEERGASPSKLKDAAMRTGAASWGLFFKSQPDTPGKLAAFAYAFEHLEIASYEQLARVARTAEDTPAVTAAMEILAQEHEAARAIAESFDRAIDASFAALGVAA